MAVFPALAVAAAWHRNAPPLARALLLAAAWTVAAWLSGHLFTGFPWNLPAYVWSLNRADDAVGGVAGAPGA